MTKRTQVEEIPCTTADELLNLLSPRSTYFGAHHRPQSINFRGHADDERYKLVPKALRKDTWLRLDLEWCRRDDLKSVGPIEAEINTVGEFCLHADRSGLPLQAQVHPVEEHFNDLKNKYSRKNGGRAGHGWPPDYLLPVLGLAQHYGVPTRLLDWTRKPLVGAYFAASEAAAKVVSKHPKAPKKLAVWALSGLELQRFTFLLKLAGGSSITLIAVPRAGNPNLHAQDGVFTLYRPPHFDPQAVPDDTPLDVHLARNQLDKSWTKLQLFHFTLPSSEAPSLLRLLAKEGVTGATLFPGYDGAAKAVHEERYWDALYPNISV